MASTKPTETEYTAAMERHGTDQWTADDARVAERYLNQHDGEEVAQEVAQRPEQGTRKGKASD